MAKSNVQGVNRLRLCPAEACRLMAKALNDERVSSAVVEVTDVRSTVVDQCPWVEVAYKAKGGDEAQP